MEDPVVLIFVIVLYCLGLVVAGIIVCVILDKVSNFLLILKKPEPGDSNYQAPYVTLSDADKALLEQLYNAPLPQSFVSLHRNLDILSAKELPVPSLDRMTVTRFFPPSELIAFNSDSLRCKGFPLKDHLAFGLLYWIGGLETMCIRLGGGVSADVRPFAYDDETGEEITLPYLGRLVSLWEEISAGPKNFTSAEIEKLSQLCCGTIPAALIAFSQTAI